MVTIAVAVPHAQQKQPAQTWFFANAEPTLEPPVTGAPYSAEGTTTVKMRMFDGTRIERSVSAKFFRDSAGRIRREQTVVGLEALDPGNDFRAVVTIVDHVGGVMYTLNPGTRTAHQLALSALKTSSPITAADQLAKARAALADAAARLRANHPDLEQYRRAVSDAEKRAEAEAIGGAKPTRQSLGTKDIDGFTATGYRDVVIIPVGQVGNDKPIEIVDERWESAELKTALYTKHSDPRSGDVEFKLTKVSRQEPAKDLFTVPAGYEIRRVPTTSASPR